MYKKLLSIVSALVLLALSLPINMASAADPLLTFTNVIISPSTGFDPSNLGKNEVLNILYSTSETPDNVVAKITNKDNVEMKLLTSNTNGTMPAWDGEYAGRIVEPGLYTVEIIATKLGYTTANEIRNFTVSYSNSNMASITNSSANPYIFDPATEDTMIEFNNTKRAELTVSIVNSNDDHIRRFNDYFNDEYPENNLNNVIWDGRNDSGTIVNDGIYKAKIVARNNYGVSVKEVTIEAKDLGNSTSTSNSHIEDISISPSTFEPGIDDDINIHFDINKDLDSLEVFAVRGTEEVEIYSDYNVDRETNFEVNWDGTDDDGEYVNEGSWRIEIRSELDYIYLTASRSLSVKYEKPFIDDLMVSKKKFDNDLDEFTYILFRVDMDALVDIDIMEGNVFDDEYIEDMDVEKDLWYAVMWDGDNYDYEDDLDIRVTTKNPFNDSVFDSEIISIDLAEDDISNTRSNVTRDYISPAAYGRSGGLELHYDIDQDADVVVTIHKGTSSSGTLVIELLDIKDQNSGAHTIAWDGKDNKGNLLSKGTYTYKIISKLTGSDTETGQFVVGDVGDVDGASSSSSSSSSGGSVAPNVTIDGGTSGGVNPIFEYCAGYTDVSNQSLYCPAIAWATSAGVVNGYADGTFKPYMPINRVEVLKVMLMASGLDLNTDNSGTAGFVDVTPWAWYMGYIKTAMTYGIFSGDQYGNTARPADTVNRSEALKLAFESLKASGRYTLDECNYAPYPDVSLGNWYTKYVCASQSYGLVDVPGGIFEPSKLSTRGEVIMMLYRLHLAGMM